MVVPGAPLLIEALDEIGGGEAYAANEAKLYRVFADATRWRLRTRGLRIGFGGSGLNCA
jgi:hypothetical protein